MTVLKSADKNLEIFFSSLVKNKFKRIFAPRKAGISRSLSSAGRAIHF